jgi:hypothetical protein
MLPGNSSATCMSELHHNSIATLLYMYFSHERGCPQCSLGKKPTGVPRVHGSSHVAIWITNPRLNGVQLSLSILA